MNELNNYQGDIPDPRTDDEKSQDYKHNDLGFGLPYWQYKKVEDLKHFTKRYQSSSLSCGAQAGAKALETIIKNVMSARPPYIARANFPEGGMWIQDLGNVFKKIGTSLELFYPSQGMGESEIDVKLNIETPYKIKGYLQPSPNNIDEIAQAIDNFGHCILLFHFNGSDWTSKPVVTTKGNNSGHYICAVDYFLDENQVKTLYIEDSAVPSTSLDGEGHRFITEEFLRAKCDGAIYFTGVNPLELPYRFTKTLRLGSAGYDTKMLQTVLNKQGDNLKVDGKFGKMTQIAVINFQIKYGLVPDGIVGNHTSQQLNQLV